MVCAFCFYHTDVEEGEKSTVCENCGMELLVYEDGSTEVLTDDLIK